MTRYAPLWQQAGSYAAALDRLLMQALWPSGGANGGAVSASATTMQVTAAPGFAAVPLQSGAGCALCRWDANETPTLAAASHPAGQTRIDLVIVQVRDNALDAGPNNDFIITSVTGVPAASNPAVPVTPTNAAVLAQVVVPGAVANLSTATLTDVRVLLNPAGEPPTTSGGTVSKLDIHGELWVAKAGVAGGAWKRARDVLHANIYKNTGWSTAPGLTGIVLDTPAFDPYGLYSLANGIFTAPVAGLWQLALTVAATASAAGQVLMSEWFNPGNTGILAAYFSQQSSGPSEWLRPLARNVLKMSAGDAWQSGTNGTTSLTGVTGAVNTFATIDYLGTG